MEKSELNTSINEIKNEIKNLDILIQEIEEKLANGKTILPMEAKKYSRLKEQKLALLEDYYDLKYYSEYILKIIEDNELIKQDFDTFAILAKLNKDLKKEFNQYLRDFKKDYNIKSKTVEAEIKKLESQIDVLTASLAESAKNNDLEAINKAKEELQVVGVRLNNIKSDYDFTYDETFKLIEDAIQKNNKKNINKITENVDKIINEYEIDLEKDNEEEEIIEEEETKEKAQKSGLWKKITAGVLTISIIAGGLAFCSSKDKNKKEVPPTEPTTSEEQEPEVTYDEERLAYFMEEKGIRENDAKLLTQNAEEISEILESNGITDIKDNQVDDLLADIYEGKNICSSAENYDSYDTYCNMMNQGNIEVYETIRGMSGYENSDLTDNANALAFAEYLDINDGSKFDTYLTELVQATQEFYKDYENEEKIQNLIDTIYRINIESGKLPAAEEGIIATFIMNACGPLQISASMNNMKVSNVKMTVDRLFDEVRDIEVIEDDCAYTRTLN